MKFDELPINPELPFNPMDPTGSYELRRNVERLRAEQTRKIFRALLRGAARRYSRIASLAGPFALAVHRSLFRPPTFEQGSYRVHSGQQRPAPSKST